MSRLPLGSSRFATVALVVAALSVGRVVTEVLPDGKDTGRPFVTEVSVGETATLRWGTVEVISVDGALETREFRTALRTPGVWIVVRATATPLVDSSTIATLELRTAQGSIITAGSRSQRNCPSSNPGIPVECTLTIDVAPQDAVGAHLALIHNLNDTRYDDEAVVDLGITEAKIAAWKARTEPIDLTPRTTS